MDAPLDTGTLQALSLIPGPDGRPLLDHVAKLALESLPATEAQLRHSAAVLDWEAARRAAHALKGTSGSFGAKALSELAKALEKAVQEEGAPQVETTLNAVIVEMARVKAALRALQHS
ncbi:MAG TPA: Hpt domain-containing protein [Holophagaceae bacterium]|nr:Hpt domain-containing protein [Holophagaceae bacterium]